MPKPVKRLSPLSIRLSASERNYLERRAAGGSLSTFVKDLLFGCGEASSASNSIAIANRALLAHLLATLGASRVAPNLDRLARDAESGDLEADEATISDLRQACDDVRLMHNALMRGLGLREGSPSLHEQGLSDAFLRAAKPEDSK